MNNKVSLFSECLRFIREEATQIDWLEYEKRDPRVPPKSKLVKKASLVSNASHSTAKP